MTTKIQEYLPINPVYQALSITNTIVALLLVLGLPILLVSFLPLKKLAWLKKYRKTISITYIILMLAYITVFIVQNNTAYIL